MSLPSSSWGCLSLRWSAWRDRDGDPWVVEVLRSGYVIPFHRIPPLSKTPIILDSYFPHSVKGSALEEEIQALCCKGAVFTFFHQLGVRMLRCLDDWLILASSREEAYWARDKVLALCLGLGILVNLEKSSLIPLQTIVYLEIKIKSWTFRTSLTPLRIEKLFSIAEEFLSSKVQSARFWRVLLGHLVSLTHLVPGGHLRMRSLQLALRRSWNFRDNSVLIPWDSPSREDLLWWCAEGRLEEGVSLNVSSPDLMFWSDASDQGWGAMVGDQFASGLWLEGEASLSVNHRELLAVQRGLLSFQDLLCGCVVAVFSDNTTAVSYLRKQGGTFSPVLNGVS